MVPPTTPVTFTSTPVLQVNVFETYSYTVKATGNADAYVTLTCTQKPLDGVSADGQRNGLTGTPLIENIGQHSVSITATDGITTVPKFYCNCGWEHYSCCFHKFPVTSVTAYDSYMYPFHQQGMGFATITVTCSEKPDWMEFAQTGNGIAQLSRKFGAADVGTHSVALQATDGLSTAHQSLQSQYPSRRLSFNFPDTYAKLMNCMRSISVEVSEHPSAQVNVCVEKPQWLSFTRSVESFYLSGTRDARHWISRCAIEGGLRRLFSAAELFHTRLRVWYHFGLY